MLERMGGTQRLLLAHLSKRKVGVTIDELSTVLAITRNAVRQHVAALVSEGLVDKGLTRASGGRPEQLYSLSDKGMECFPRHYTWFAQLLLDSVARDSDADGVARRMVAMGAQAGAGLRAQHPGPDGRADKLGRLVGVLDGMGYEAHADPGGDGAIVEVGNCVFHALARDNPALCQFDLALLEAFSGVAPEHEVCLATGGAVCRFRFPVPEH